MRTAVSAADPPARALLTNAMDVISLSADEAARYLKVSVTGVVTAADPVLKGRFFMQDATGGVFVDNVNGPRLKPGDLVEVSGITYPGAYAPTITAPRVRVLGSAPLPPARSVSIEQLASGAEDSQRIEFSGIVRDARVENSRLIIDLASGGYRFRAYAIAPPGSQFQELVGSQVRIRGTAAEAHNRMLRQLIFVEVYVPDLSDLVIEKTEPVNPFDKPVTPLNNLAQYRRDNSLGQRIHVRGVVTFQKPGESLFLEDAVGSLQLQSRQSDVVAPGDVIEAVGFPSIEKNHPVLQDAVFRKTLEPVLPLRPRFVSVDELLNGLHHAEFVSLSGTLIERTIRPGRMSTNSPGGPTTILVLQGSNFTFTAQADFGPGHEALAAIPIGSVLRVDGICLTEIDRDGKLQSCQILVRDPAGVQILRRPSWLTPRRLLIGFAVACSVLAVLVGWTIMVSRKNSVLNYLIREREQAQQALQQANDQLEERVKARTEQLKFQITARETAEVRFKAVLAERTRLAQELHDTVEQTLTGIALQLDTAAKQYERNPADARSRLELARSLMSRSQLEVRQSVWDLRRLVQDQFDLPGALLENAREITSGINIQVDFQTDGPLRPLPEVVEETFLRIGREALVNVVKHSGAAAVSLRLEFAPQGVLLRIQDNGRGFILPEAPGPTEGHFGLLGMSERVKRIGGRFHVVTAPGQGVTIEAEVPLDPLPEPLLPDITSLQDIHEEARQNPHPDC